MKLTVLNDVHIGALRTAGTTATTQWALRQHILSEFEKLLPKDGSELMILGDLFDTNNVPLHDVLKTFSILANWLSKSSSPKLYMVAGNHDLSKISNILSSFDFLCELLTAVAGDKVVTIKKPTMTPHGYVIPHLPNQDLFNLALDAVPTCTNLFLHCNYDNNFAAQSDQSLNLSKEYLDKLPISRVIIAHEHHKRCKGKVWIPGNQIASSVSDWLSDSNKHYLVLNDGAPTLVECADKNSEFTEMYWKELEVTDHKFVRVTGMASSEEASAHLTAINKLRAAHKALVITNAVQVVTEDNSAEFEANLESAQSFSILDALKEFLTDAEFAKVQDVNSRK